MQIFFRSPRVCGFLCLLSATVSLHGEDLRRPDDEITRLEEFVVTGSHIPATPESVAVPVTVIDTKNIERSGIGADLLGVLQKTMPAFSGGANIGTSAATTNNTQTYGGSRISLHNLPTLVLINGRRVATNGGDARGRTGFVDISQFPLAAIERIEVLTDGASALYGSDAIGGVVNVILKPEFNGAEIGGRYAFSTATGNYSERSAYLTAGASNSRVSVVVNASYSKTDPLYQGDRSFSSVATTGIYSGVIGSVYLDPALNSPREAVPVGTAATANTLADTGVYLTGDIPPLNLADDVTLLVGRERYSAYTGFTLKLIDRTLTAFGDVLYSDGESFSQLGAQAVTFSGTGSNPPRVAAGTPYNPTTVSLNPRFRYLPAPRRYTSETTFFRATGGLRGEINPDWNWEAAYTHNKNKLVARIENVLYGPNLGRAVAGGYDQNGNAVGGGAYSRVVTGFSESGSYVYQPALDPFARPAAVDPASLANILGTSRADFTSQLTSTDAVVRGNVFDLPAGNVGIAFGGDYREERLEGMPDENSRVTGPTAQNWSGGTFFDPFSADREVVSGVAEIRVPLTGPGWNLPGVHALDVSAAYRVENYSDFGEARSPKYGVSWQPFDEQITLRYSYSKAFAAPQLYQLFGPNTQGLSVSLTDVLGFDDDDSRQANLRTGSNRDLDPITAKTDSFGIVWAPKFARGLKITVNYLETEVTNFVDVVGAATIAQSVNQLGAASPYANQVASENFYGENGAVPITAPGELRDLVDDDSSSVFITDTNQNVASIQLRAVDVTLEYLWPTASFGEFDLSTTGTYFLDYKVQALPTESYHEHAGLVTANDGTIPGYRFYTALNWRISAWDFLVANTYISGVDDIGTSGRVFAESTSLKRIPVEAYSAWDVAIGYTIRSNAKPDDGVRLQVGVNNVTDEMPSVSRQAFATPQPRADVATYSPIGRLYHMSVAVKF